MSEREYRHGEGWALRLPESVEESGNPLLGRLTIVLCQPAGSANVGSVCRAMKSMGVSKLRIVGRNADFFNRGELAQMALSAIDIFQKAQFYEDLSEALTGFSLSAGLTRRRGSFRKYFTYAPEQLVDKVKSLGESSVALVLGNERSGLSDYEMTCCHTACAIPTSPAYPSLNLSHAVQLISYHFFRAQFAKFDMGFTTIDNQEIDKTTKVIIEGLQTLGLHDNQEKHRSFIFFRDLIARAALSSHEAKRLRRLLKSVRHKGVSSKD